jgi:hypothetical protein
MESNQVGVFRKAKLGFTASCKASTAVLWKHRYTLSPEQFLTTDTGRGVSRSEVQWTSDSVSFHSFLFLYFHTTISGL